MIKSKYILVYPFGVMEQAFDVANSIDGSLMWQNGTAYPRDNIPAFIIPLSEFSGRWTRPNHVKELEQENQRLLVLATKHCSIDHHDFNELKEIAQNKE